MTTQPIATAPNTPGAHFIGVTANGRCIFCTVGDNGNFHTDTHEVCKLVGWVAF